MTISPSELARSALERRTANGVSYQQFVLELERAVDAAEETDDPRASQFMKLWGELEVLNAVTEGNLDVEQQAEVAEICAKIEKLLE